MINLAEGIEERAIERTTKAVTKKVTKKVTEGVVMNMYELGYTYVQISEATNLDVEVVETIIDQNCMN